MTDKKNTLEFNRPGLFVPSVIRNIVDAGPPTGLKSFSEFNNIHIGTTSSFRYDSPGEGLKSTQQITVDYSKFENHTFFQSAQTNVNLAFYKIINEFPFDGTEKEIEQFLDSLTGFEKYVYDQFPKNKGYLFFSGSGAPDGGSYIRVEDFAGSIFPTIAKNKTGQSVLNPKLKSLSLEMHLFLPEESNDVQVVCQKLSGSTQGLTLFVSESASTSTADLIFTAVSASSILSVSSSLNKGSFQHIVANFDRAPENNRLNLYVNQTLQDTSENSINFGEIDFNVSPLFIGSGSEFIGNNLETVTPITTLSGAIDEFRFFHSNRTIDQQKEFGRKTIYNTNDLVLYFKFNEPSSSFAATADNVTNRVVLDYSGNSLHGLINESGFDFSLRETSSIENPMTHEDLSRSPILFPNFSEVLSLNTNLLTSASTYDISNSNLITRLVPPHYFLEGQDNEGFEDEEGTIKDRLTGENIPGSADEGQAQIMQTLLYIWAKFFDEIKIYLDTFGKVLNVSYDGIESVPDNLLVKLGDYFGFSLPSLFSDASVPQFINSDNLEVDFTKGTRSLQSIQNQIWRRILVNLQDIIQSKGTVHSVKAFIRALGIDPDSNFTIREYGGPTKNNLSNLRESKREVSTLLDMSGSNVLLQSNYLITDRIEIGYPYVSAWTSLKNLEDGWNLYNGTNDTSFTWDDSFGLRWLYPSATGALGSFWQDTQKGIFVWKTIKGPFDARIRLDMRAADGSTALDLTNGGVKIGGLLVSSNDYNNWVSVGAGSTAVTVSRVQWRTNDFETGDTDTTALAASTVLDLDIDLRILRSYANPQRIYIYRRNDTSQEFVGNVGWASIVPGGYVDRTNNNQPDRPTYGASDDKSVAFDDELKIGFFVDGSLAGAAVSMRVNGWNIDYPPI